MSTPDVPEATVFLTEEEAKVDAEMQEEDRVAEAEAKAEEESGETKEEEKEEEAPAAKAEEEAPAAKVEEERSTEEDVRDPRIAVVVAQPVQDFDKRIAAIQEQKAQIGKKLEDGELTTTEWLKQHDALSEQQQDLKLQQRDAVQAERQNESNARQAWADICNDFRGEHPELKDPIRSAAWDASLKQLLKDVQGTADEARSMHWHLKTAYERMNESLGVKAAEPAPVRKETPAPKPAARERPAAPRTLAQTPAAAAVDTGVSEFAKLEKLEGMDLERAIARMPEEDYDRWLQGA